MWFLAASSLISSVHPSTLPLSVVPVLGVPGAREPAFTASIYPSCSSQDFSVFSLSTHSSTRFPLIALLSSACILRPSPLPPLHPTQRRQSRRWSGLLKSPSYGSRVFSPKIPYPPSPWQVLFSCLNDKEEFPGPYPVGTTSTLFLTGENKPRALLLPTPSPSSLMQAGSRLYLSMCGLN